MKTKFFIALLLLTIFAYGQTPKIYINFVSHNEPGDNLQATLNFNAMVPKVLQLAAMMDSNGAAWNLQTCDGFASGALKIQGAASNIFRTLEQAPYADNMEIDPRYKQTIYPQIADLYHILDSLGAKPTTTLGGFVCNSNNKSQIDWFKYQDTIQAGNFPWVKWKCNIMWGAGSLPPHDNDLNDYGIWKPDTNNNFYAHNSTRPVWFIGNGCQPLYGLDSTENEQTIISTIRGAMDSIQKKLWPQNKFYVYTISINQSHFGPTLFQKVSTICDSVNSWGTGKIQWSTLTQKLSAFQAWQASTLLTHSQWLCGEKTTGIDDIDASGSYTIYPNPSNTIYTIDFKDSEKHQVMIYDLKGTLIETKVINGYGTLDISEGSNGLYLLRIDNKHIEKLVKE